MEILKLDYGVKVPENYTGIVEYNNGDTGYYLNGILHREDGPAFIYPNGNAYYYINGFYHREDGPAVIHPNGNMYYYLNDKNITEEVEEWIKDNNIPKVWDNSHKLLFKLTFG